MPATTDLDQRDALHAAPAGPAHPGPHAEITELDGKLPAPSTGTPPSCCSAVGIGPDSAAALLITAGDNPDGCTAKPPSPRCAASARSRRPRARPSRRRLNRGGDRHANSALYRSPDPASLGSTHPRLPATPHRRGQDPPRSHPLPQALHRPRDLQPHHTKAEQHYHRQPEQPLDIHRGIGLTGFLEAVEATWPQTTVQTCTVPYAERRITPRLSLSRCRAGGIGRARSAYPVACWTVQSAAPPSAWWVGSRR